MSTRRNDWGWPDVHTGECAAFSGRIDQHAELERDIMAELEAWDPMGRRSGPTEPSPLRHRPLTDADVGVNVPPGSRREHHVAGMPESVVRPSTVADDRLARRSFNEPEEEGIRVALSGGAVSTIIEPMILSNSRASNWEIAHGRAWWHPPMQCKPHGWDRAHQTRENRQDVLALKGTAIVVKAFPWLDDAAAAFRHYLGNTGRLYEIDMKELFRENPSLYDEFLERKIAAYAFARTLSPGRYRIMEKNPELIRSEVAGLNWNWNRTLGGFHFQGGADVEVTPQNVRIRLTLHLADNYDWDESAQMGRFHDVGLACAFPVVGDYTEEFVVARHGH